MEIKNVLLMVLVTFVFVTLFIPVVKKMAEFIGAMDIPNARKVHKVPIPRLGGLGIYAGFLLGYMLFGVHSVQMNAILIGSFIILVTGIFDDIKPVPAKWKLLAQTVGASIVPLYGEILLQDISAFGLYIDFGILAYPITIIFIVAIINCINLIDGLDGLSSGITLISCISLLIIFALNESPLIAIILITALAGAIVGFLPYNFNPAKTFIGDVGSNFMGFAIAVISILGVAKTYTAIVIIAPIIVLALPIFDTLWAIVRRIVKGKSIKAVFKPDKGHLHHRLMAKGYTQKQAVLILYGITATLGMVAIILLDSGIWKALSFALLVVVFVALGYKDILHLREDEDANSNEKVSTEKENNKENS